VVNRPFRFMVSGISCESADQLVSMARRAEQLGYDCMVFSDHRWDEPAPIPSMVMAATATHRLRVGTYVLNNDFRHPVLLGQELSTVDVWSRGRLLVGLGAGWNAEEYELCGLPFDPGAVRVRRLNESIQILKRFFAGKPFDFEGDFYHVRGVEGRPLPLQQPHPPLLIGGSGRAILSLAAREADVVGLAPRVIAAGRPDILNMLAPATDQKLGWIRQAAGARFEELEIGTYRFFKPLEITEHASRRAREVADEFGERFGAQVTPEEILDSPHLFFGTVEQLVDKCLAMRERWQISNIMIWNELEEFAPVVERLAGR